MEHLKVFGTYFFISKFFMIVIHNFYKWLTNFQNGGILKGYSWKKQMCLYINGYIFSVYLQKNLIDLRHFITPPVKGKIG